MLRKIIAFFIVFLGCSCLYAQKTKSTVLDDSTSVEYTVINGDTLYSSKIEPVYIFPTKKFRSFLEEYNYWRLVKNIKIVYPYAILAKNKLAQMNNHFITIKNGREKNRYVKEVEDTMKAQYEDELTKLTVTQGKLLFKLIDRETGNTTFALVKELKGSFSAFVWQAVARLFGSTLKSTYDPNGEDRVIEEILIMIDQGQL